MKKRILLLLTASITVAILASCSFNPFTQSLGKELTRNQVERFSKAPAGELANLAGTSLSSSELQALINALAGKTEAELKALSPTQAENVLSAATGAIISNSIISDLIEKAPSGSATKEEIFNTVINGVNGGVKTDAISTLLNNPAQINAIAKDSPETVLLAAAALLGEMTKETKADIGTITNKIKDITSGSSETPSSIAGAIAGVLSPKQPTDPDIQAVANIMAAVYGNPTGGYNKIVLSGFGFGF